MKDHVLVVTYRPIDDDEGGDGLVAYGPATREELASHLEAIKAVVAGADLWFDNNQPGLKYHLIRLCEFQVPELTPAR